MLKRFLVVSCLVLAAGAAGASAAQGSELSRKILDESGVRGGFVVHVGCGDGTLTAALGSGAAYLVHGLDEDAEKVKAAREHIRTQGLYGRVAVEQWSGGDLPYVDNLVNLMVVNAGYQVSQEEIMRVLAPRGVVVIRDGGNKTLTKPVPPEFDEWTHYLYDASNNAVSRDTAVEPPRQLRWVGSPRWARHHDRMASMNALVSSHGRLFYVFDEGPTSSIMLPPSWRLIARDAFSGVILWKRRLPTWHPHMWPMKSGFAQMPRRLVAVDDKVFVPLGYEEALSCLDAATGETLRTYPDTKSAEEVICSDGVLFVLVNPSPSQYTGFKPMYEDQMWNAMRYVASSMPWNEQPRWITAIRIDTGELLWKKEHRVAPLTLTCSADSVLFFDGERVVRLNRKSGETGWRSGKLTSGFPKALFSRAPQKVKEVWRPEKTKTAFVPTSFAPTLVSYRNVILFSGGDGRMSGISAETGKILWTEEALHSGHFSPQDCMVMDGLVWTALIAGGRDAGTMVGRDPLTGEIKREFLPDIKSWYMHHRCHRAKATDRYFIASRTGIEFVDYCKKTWEDHHWTRGGCLYGIMPCNGLLYAPPHSCACYMQSKLNGFNALAGKSTMDAGHEIRERLEKGLAYGHSSTRTAQSADDWPTYRHDSERSGCSKTAVPAGLKQIWTRDIGGRLSTMTVAAGRCFVASIDRHTVHALNAKTGAEAWSFTAGGRVDSPPTIWNGHVLFGSADGHVYCLRPDDGTLIWRVRAAPGKRRIIAFEQVESSWPIHGSVLVQDDACYCVAGRSMFLDGGIRLLKIEIRTGKILLEVVMDDRDPETGRNLQSLKRAHNMPVALPDVLSSDGKYLYMRSQRITLDGKREDIAPIDVRKQGGEGRHLFSPIGFLDGSWWHRGYWVYGTEFGEGAGGYSQAQKYAPAGRIMVFDDSTLYGYGRKPQYYKWTTPLEYRLFAAKKALATRYAPARASKGQSGKKTPRISTTRPQFVWNQDIPIQVRAMVLAHSTGLGQARKTLFVAGPADIVDETEVFHSYTERGVQKTLAEQRDILEGKKGVMIRAVSVEDGATLGEYPLTSLPVWDGLVAAGGRLYLSNLDGSVICLGD